MTQKLINDWLMIWVTIEPFSTLALFVSITANMTPGERRKTALKTTVYSAAILLAAIVIGQVILTAMNIRLVSFQIAGGHHPVPVRVADDFWREYRRHRLSVGKKP